MLLDLARRGVFAAHPGRYRLRLADAADPAALLADPALAAPDGRPFFAVFLNYLLDCLPAAVLRADPGGGLAQLCARTCLARGVDLREYTDLSADDLARLAAAPDPAARDRLRDVVGLLAADYAFRPVAPADVPRPADGLAAAAARPGTPVVHSYGALGCLEAVLRLVRPDGFVLVNDYGPADGAAGPAFEHQRFTGSTFVGVNFAQLKAHFAGPDDGTRWAEPAEGAATLRGRLLGHRLPPAVVGVFRDRFGEAAAEHQAEPVRAARAAAGSGRVEAAATAYREALGRQPGDWLLLLEVANFLTFKLGDPAAGAAVARAGLDLNPGGSAGLWNAYGDALFEAGRVAAAGAAFRRALAVDPEGVQARYNLAWVHLRRRDHAAALRMIADGLARDGRGEYRDRLLQKQTEVLADLARRAQREAHSLLNRVSAYPGPVDPPG